MASKKRSLEEAATCSKCKTTRVNASNYCHPEFYGEGEVTVYECLECFESKKKHALCRWCYCHTCGVVFSYNNVRKHRNTLKHKKKSTYTSSFDVPTASHDPPIPLQAIEFGTEIMGPLDPLNDPMEFAMTDEDMNENMEALAEQQLMLTYEENGQSAMDISTTPLFNGKSTPEEYPDINMKGNEWLAEELKDIPIATTSELYEVFDERKRPGFGKMKNFHVAELASGEGKCGGGGVYLVSKAFQQKKDSQIDTTKFPDFEEAKLQMQYLIQFQTTNEKQRMRQAMLTKEVANHLPPGVLFRQTFFPPYNEMGKYYGNTGQNSMLLNMPYPEATVIGGVSYISPRNLVQFILGNGVPIDKIVVRGATHPSFTNPVHNVDQCRKAIDCISRVKQQYYRENLSNSENVPPVVILFVTDWKDGFGSGKCKNNRNSVDVKSITIGAPREHINSTDNTLPVAIGLKDAPGWVRVEKLYHQEIQEMSKPEKYYLGALQKIVHVVCQRLAVITDKIERPTATGTLGPGGDTHRCFGTAGKIQTPSCKVREAKAHLKKQQDGTEKGSWGWSDQFVSTAGNPNGGRFPSCIRCRKAGLQQLGIVFAGEEDASAEIQQPCTQCTNWELMPDSNGASLDFPAHPDYPKKITQGSPVPPPEGRNVFQEAETKLPFIEISWSMMKQASRFAFFQASRPKKFWTKTATICYLKSCGINNDLATQIWENARACGKEKKHDTVRYDSREGIGDFEWPAAWLGGDISVKGYIEAIMHMLYLGIEESNFELIKTWLSDTPAAGKVGQTPFLKALQVLLKDLRPFMLSWLPIYPLTGKKGKLGTGSWVGENRLSFIRISQIIYGWCARHHKFSSKYGVDDMSRVVIAYICLVSRLMTHGGIDDEYIKEVCLYQKEFLSAVREFDIRIRHEELNKGTNNVSERKGTEAWWLKSNYMSLPNLLTMMIMLGPLILWWDGGGKGERFIQLVKPHLKQGVWEDVLNFFKHLHEKLLQLRQLEILESRYGLSKEEQEAIVELSIELSELLIDVADSLLPQENTDDANKKNSKSRGSNNIGEEEEEEEEDVHEEEEEEEDGHKEEELDEESTATSSDSSDSTASSNEEPSKPNIREDVCFSMNEAHGMTKLRTIYIYRNYGRLAHDRNVHKPIAGVVEVASSPTGKTAFEFKAVCRKPVKQFASYKVTFNDTEGVMFHGMWYAPINLQEDDESVRCTHHFGDLQASAKLSAVAIPLWYAIGTEHRDSGKYCVITNWWKYRMSDGRYRLPTLDATLYDGAKPKHKARSQNQPQAAQEDDIKFPTMEVLSKVVNPEDNKGII